ncbi:MAG: hypothetical protein GEU28_09780 [Dehalococcoidia bacterium]|nr:hypothetical protein [Dehalococcoidia bacterium]
MGRGIAYALCLLASAGFVFHACGGDRSDAFQRPEDAGEHSLLPIVMTTELVVGANRFTFQVLDAESQNIPDAEVGVRKAYLGDGDDELGPPQEASYLVLELEALETVVDHRHPDGSLHVHSTPFASGLYSVPLEFDRAGEWGVELEIGYRGDRERVPLVVTVLEDGATPGPGDPAPRTENHTLTDLPLEELTSDPQPDAGLYHETVADVLASDRPLVVAFATPAFCHSRVCAPVLEAVKQVMASHAEAGFVHIEPFENLTDPANLRDSPFAAEWNLPNEPWVFVIDGNGIVSASFEGPFTVEELEEALAGAG